MEAYVHSNIFPLSPFSTTVETVVCPVIWTNRRGADVMETWYYEVVSIDGDYANLRRTDIESDDLKLVARALLPPEIAEGSRLKYEMMTYTME